MVEGEITMRKKVKKVKKVYYIFYDFTTNCIEVLTDDMMYSNDARLGDIKDLCKEECIIYINDLKAISSLIPGGQVKSQSFDLEKGDVISYKYDKATMRSFSVLKPANVSLSQLTEVFKAKNIPHMMYLYIQSYGGPFKVSLTLASQAKKDFYAPIRYCLWDDIVGRKRYANNTNEWNLLYTGRKSGLLKDVNKIKTYNYDIIAFDIKSAYAAAFVQDDKFPIGKPRFTKNKSMVIECLQKKEWVKIVTSDPIPELIDYVDERTMKIGIEYYDFFTLKMQGIDIIRLLNEHDWDVIYSDKTGYLHYEFRKRAMYYYDAKNRCAKNTPERLLKKAPLETLYGKSIQWREMKKDSDVVAYYKGRGENYLLPHMGNHASAYVRYTLEKILKEFGDDCVYWDTDGVKIKRSEKVIEYFKKLNEEIYQKNLNSGYDSDIGTFELEAEMKSFCEVRSKIYLYKDKNNEIISTMAGFDEYAKEGALYYAEQAKRDDESIFDCMERDGVLFLSKCMVKTDDGLIDIGYEPSFLNPIRQKNEKHKFIQKFSTNIDSCCMLTLV